MHSRAHCTLLTAVRIHRYASSLTLSLRFKSVIHSPSMPPGGTAPTNKSNIPECVVRKVCWIIKWIYQMFSLWLTGIKVTGYWWAERGRDGGSGLGRLGNGEFFYRTIKSPPNKRLVSILKYFSRLSWSSRRTWSPFLKQVIIILCLSDQQRGVIYHHCVRHSLVNSI